MYEHLLKAPSADEILENFLNSNEQYFGVEWRKMVEQSLDHIHTAQESTETM